MDITIIDVALIFQNFQSSKCKMWEIVRSYNPIHMAALLYMLENLVLNRKCESVELHNLRVSNRTRIPIDFTITEQTMNLNTLRPTNANDRCCAFNMNGKQRQSSRIIELNGIKMESSKFMNVLELLELVKDEKRLNMLSEPVHEDEYPLNMANRVIARTVLYNATTPEWRKFLHHMVFQLFPDNLQIARYDNVSNVSMTASSIVNKYLNYYKMMTQPDIYDTINSMDLKYMILPKPVVCSRDQIYSAENVIIQPYYHGFYIIVNASDTSIRVYNRWSENVIVSSHIQTAIRESIKGLNCSLIAILLPKDGAGNLRSWRYWPYKTSCDVMIIDILRYKSKSLVALPLVERLKYLENISTTKSIKIIDSTQHIVNYEKRYNECDVDLYSAMIGVVAKPKFSRLSTKENLVYRFPVKYTFDLMTNCVVSVESDKNNDIPKRLFFNPELAQYQTTVMIYNHDAEWYYACRYNLDHHQFEHWCRFQKYEHDMGDDNNDATKYAVSERIMVLNSPIPLTRGVFYLRVYYNDDREYLGYDRKFTASRYDIPLCYDFDDWVI